MNEVLPWSKKSSNLKRKVGTRGQPKLRFLIVCEGTQTEPNYFRNFRVSSATVLDIKGFGLGPDKLVTKAVELAENAKRNKHPYDRIWCVFDRDDIPADTFNRAFSLADKHGINIAYSNEAFELWYLLHYIFFDSAISRKDYIEKLNTALERKYSKNDMTIYEELIARQDTAIKNAEKLLSCYQSINPEANNPSTNVHLLVQELRNYC